MGVWPPSKPAGMLPPARYLAFVPQPAVLPFRPMPADAGPLGGGAGRRPQIVELHALVSWSRRSVAFGAPRPHLLDIDEGSGPRTCPRMAGSSAISTVADAVKAEGGRCRAPGPCS
jgi:hypothetical protein